MFRKDGVSEELRKKIQKLAVEMGYQFQKNKQEQTPCYTIGIITSYRYIEKGQSFYWAMYERVLFHLSQGNHIGILEVISESDFLQSNGALYRFVQRILK